MLVSGEDVRLCCAQPKAHVCTVAQRKPGVRIHGIQTYSTGMNVRVRVWFASFLTLLANSYQLLPTGQFYLIIHHLTSSEPLPKVESLGCYYDNEDRALPELYANFRPQVLWLSPNRTIQQCTHVARDMGYQYFAVQFYGECWAGKNGAHTYNKHGKAADKDCWRGLGADWRNSVYRFN